MFLDENVIQSLFNEMVFYRIKGQRRKLLVLMNDDDSVTVGITEDNGQDKLKVEERKSVEK
ncbi:unnamed protein product [Eruca vesicaria subsp. sativa]|uniref:Uncharacterized protein n=1 Tax=Eruca vesicaria subsp. sativa TaxID=29727 RepID=A0ABC8LW90_ERUVS|nr:unnamed protein product [Eruca vesicaria subsp. sativa]